MTQGVDIKKVGFISLGCPKALVDSERILTQLRAEGYHIAPTYEEADTVIVNTCGFITPAVEESLSAIGEALDATGKVIVTGCLGERPETIRERHPKVHSITGSQDVEGVMDAIHELIPPDTNPFTSLIPDTGVKLTPKHYAYLKIAEGCNHKCAFCIIPKLRGLQVSRDAGEVLYEAFRLIASGTKEIMVISQDTSAYGVDIRHRESEFQGGQVKAHLIDLATKLGEMGAWVRMHYVYPYPHVDEVVKLMAEGKILPYLDVPLQHASPKVLKAMRRPGAGKQLETIKRWRDICPDLAIRSTFIVGFPGETEEDFQLLLDFLREARLDRVGCFTYSDVQEADATRFAEQVPEEVKQDRLERFMAVQQEISLERMQEKIGRVIEVIIDDYNEEPGQLIGRSKWDAPGIDGSVMCVHGDLAESEAARLIPAGSIKIGDIVRVLVEDADEYDLYGEIIEVVPWKPNVPQLGHFGKH
ncbi:30S ribosomal protein S12 methylthiotransferase RimO [Deinococcus cellulosilyticus]|uniref:Ribosomal protein uS12 methylthiotransferase RimO n=1 Tax=Deinococcus cellulosilyticus (strain DSM 18568 / NBRC 106333 / KACC 11606 / 5516J-15) TaxID=1223518 RepID=A0A511N2E0_DEIC1|nr:30S ribosomal protein S12 methylthiotransferase RimO [Deinococcus cellulosilyticus]GEM46576.1 ribosomal protein S12 methylthiotransferase RimO [Deinococcus cellulosilyticus NBRC 106333 = KACC 11606]